MVIFYKGGGLAFLVAFALGALLSLFGLDVSGTTAGLIGIGCAFVVQLFCLEDIWDHTLYWIPLPIWSFGALLWGMNLWFSVEEASPAGPAPQAHVESYSSGY